MDKIILDIVEARKKQGLSETALANSIGEDQNKIWRLLNGKTKKLDLEVIGKLQTALGIVSEAGMVYAGSAVHQQITAEESELLRYFRQLCPDQKHSAMQMVKGLLLLAQQSRKNENPEEGLKELKCA